MFSKLITVSLILVSVFSLSPLANADHSCDDLYADLYTWASVNRNYIEVTIASAHSPTNNWVSYSKGNLDYFSVFPISGLSGNVDVYYSDRYNYSSCSYYDPNGAQPFDKRQTDETEVIILVDGLVLLDSVTWNTSTWLECKCENGFMYGFTPDNGQMLTFTFQKRSHAN